MDLPRPPPEDGASFEYLLATLALVSLAMLVGLLGGWALAVWTRAC